MGRFDILLQSPTEDEQALFVAAMRLGYATKKGCSEDRKQELNRACDTLKEVLPERRGNRIFTKAYERGQQLARMYRFEAADYPFEVALAVQQQLEKENSRG